MAKKKTNKALQELIFGGAREVAPDTTIEKINPLFFDTTKLLHQPEPLYRLDSGNHRYYYRFENDEPVFYTSVTTLIKNTLPTSPHLIQWLVSKQGEGRDEALERAFYGTFLHIQCSTLLINGKYNLDELPQKLEDFAKAEKVTVKKEWADELKKDVLAFSQFVIDKNVKPLAIEICLWHPIDGYAGAIDLVCELDFNRQRVLAIVDIKSGRKGFYESHEVQLGAYKEMWNYHFGVNENDMGGMPSELAIGYLFNWSPKSWKKSPTYNFVNQTESKNIPKLPHLVQLSKIEADKREDTFTIVSGEIDITKGLDSNIKERTLVELVKEHIND